VGSFPFSLSAVPVCTRLPARSRRCWYRYLDERVHTLPSPGAEGLETPLCGRAPGSGAGDDPLPLDRFLRGACQAAPASDHRRHEITDENVVQRSELSRCGDRRRIVVPRPMTFPARFNKPSCCSLGTR
jgi:hypothetical protein